MTNDHAEKQSYFVCIWLHHVPFGAKSTVWLKPTPPIFVCGCLDQVSPVLSHRVRSEGPAPLPPHCMCLKVLLNRSAYTVSSVTVSLTETRAGGGGAVGRKFPCNTPTPPPGTKFQGNFSAGKIVCKPPPPPYKISVLGNFRAISCELSFSVCWV